MFPGSTLSLHVKTYRTHQIRNTSTFPPVCGIWCEVGWLQPVMDCSQTAPDGSVGPQSGSCYIWDICLIPQQVSTSGFKPTQQRLKKKKILKIGLSEQVFTIFGLQPHNWHSMPLLVMNRTIQLWLTRTWQHSTCQHPFLVPDLKKLKFTNLCMRLQWQEN